MKRVVDAHVLKNFDKTELQLSNYKQDQNYGKRCLHKGFYDR